MQVCGECGVVRAGDRTACPHCEAPYQGPVEAPGRDGDDRYWVCIECTFKCRMCRFDVPLNHLDTDGAVMCARCGLEQAFQGDGWKTVFAHAHGTGDLWMESELDRDRCSSRRDGIGENAVAVTASPGYPRCEKCHAQLEIAADEGKTSTSCVCGEKASYEIPKATQRTTGHLQGVIAMAHRSDRKAVKVEQGAAAIAVACPSCNAPLEANETSKFLTCAFCHTTSRIPDRTWFRISGKEPKPDPMWLLFRGASARRAEVDEQKLEALREVERAAKRVTLEEALAAQRAEEVRKEARKELERQEQERKDAEAAVELARIKREQDRSGNRFVLVVMTCLFLVSAAIAFAAIHWHW